MQRYVEWIIRYRFSVIVLALLATLLAVYQARHIKIIIDMNATLPQSHPYIATTNQIERIFGSMYVVVIGISPKSGDIYQPAVLTKVRYISTALLGAKGIVT